MQFSSEITVNVHLTPSLCLWRMRWPGSTTGEQNAEEEHGVEQKKQGYYAPRRDRHASGCWTRDEGSEGLSPGRMVPWGHRLDLGPHPAHRTWGQPKDLAAGSTAGSHRAKRCRGQSFQHCGAAGTPWALAFMVRKSSNPKVTHHLAWLLLSRFAFKVKGWVDGG